MIQSWVWSVDSFTDQNLWVERLQHMRRDLQDGSFNQDDYSGHPGTTVLLAAAGMQALGFSETAGLKAAVVLLVSGASAGIATVARKLSGSLWWLAAGGMIALHPLFVKASPVNAVAASWLTLMLLAAFVPAPWLLGVSLGVGLATHFSLALLLGVPTLLFIGWQRGWKAGLQSLAASLLSFALLDPLLVQQPAQHLGFIFQRIALHTTQLGIARLSLFDLPLFAPLAIVSFMLASFWIWRGWDGNWSRSTLGYIVGLTVAVSGALLYAQSQSVRYFFPLIMFWEAMLPWWLMHFAQRLRYPAVVSAVGIGILLAGQTVLLIQALY